MAKVHERTVEFAITLVAAADTLQVTSVKYYRDDAQLAAGAGFSLAYSPATALTSPADIFLGELMPPPTRVRFTFPVF